MPDVDPVTSTTLLELFMSMNFLGQRWKKWKRTLEQRSWTSSIVKYEETASECMGSEVGI
jgi:hypothetical protein